MLTPDDLLMTPEDHLIFRRVTGVMTQERYHRADRHEASIMTGMEICVAWQREGRGDLRAYDYDWHTARAGIGLSNTEFLAAFYPELLAGGLS